MDIISKSTRPDGRSEDFLATNTRRVNAGSLTPVSPTGARKRGNYLPQGVKQIASTLLSVVLNILAAGFLFYAIFNADEWMRELMK